jgi:hypothetical protein
VIARDEEGGGSTPVRDYTQAHFFALSHIVLISRRRFSAFSQAGIVAHKTMAGGKYHAMRLRKPRSIMHV